MKKEKGLKIKTILLVLGIMVLLIGLPSTASAKTVAKIGKKNYSSLQSALNAVKKGQTIKIQCNVDMKKKTLVSKKNVSYTIDLRGKKIWNSLGFNVKKGKVWLKNGSFEQAQDRYLAKIDKRYKVYENICISKGASVTMTDLKYRGGCRVNKGAKLVIKGGTYKYMYLFNYGTSEIKSGTFYPMNFLENTRTMKITGGRFTVTGAFDSGMGVWNEGNMTISGGVFQFLSPGELENAGKLKIKARVYRAIRRSISNSEGYGRIQIY